MRKYNLTGIYAIKELVWLNFSLCLKVAVHRNGPAEKINIKG